jgi:DNA-binding NarL/FixJ family response regulator
MTKKRVAIVDDDPFVVAHLKNALARRLPEVDVMGVLEPVAPAGFHVYIVDREFAGDSHGRGVVQRIRAVSPASLVLVYSAHLDREFLRELLREGCEGAFDKGSLEELDSMMAIIESYLLTDRAGGAVLRGIGNTVRAISGLLHEWNLRLDNNGRAHAKTFGDG